MQDLVRTVVDFGGRRFALTGLANDAYFDNAVTNMSNNDLLCAVLLHHVAPWSTAIDVGANIGITTSLINRFVENASIVSLEPSAAYQCLVDTCERNEFKNQRSLKCCVGAEDGSVSFVSVVGNTAASHIIASTGGPVIPMRSLDSVANELGLSRCDFVKVDVEGFELGVLDGMARINRDFQPLIFMEFNSYCLTALADLSPRGFLERIIREFGCFLARKSVDGTDLEVVRPDGIVPFLHRNMLQRGCVEDIIFSANPARIAAFQLG